MTNHLFAVLAASPNAIFPIIFKLFSRSSGTRLLFASFLTVVPLSSQAQFNYVTNIDATLTITAYTGPGGPVVVPSTIDGLPVTGIGSAAFYDAFVDSVILPDSITSFGTSAFAGCFELTDINLPAGLTSLGDSTFEGCYLLTSLVIPNGVTSIGKYEFYQCYALTNLTLPADVTDIGDYAFAGCTHLGSITIPDGVVTLGNAVFRECYALTNLMLSTNLSSIGTFEFYECTSLTNLTIPGGVYSIGDYAFGWCTQLGALCFNGNAPTLLGPNTFFSEFKTTVYYILGTYGWSTTFGGRPTKPLVKPPSLSIAGATLLSFTNLTIDGDYQFQALQSGAWTDVGYPFLAVNTSFFQYVDGARDGSTYQLARVDLPDERPLVPHTAAALRLGCIALGPNLNYQVQASFDLQSWTNVGPLFYSTSATNSQYVNFLPGKSFFRLKYAP